MLPVTGRRIEQSLRQPMIREPRLQFAVINLRMRAIRGTRNRYAQSQDAIETKARIDTIDALHRFEEQSRAGEQRY